MLSFPESSVYQSAKCYASYGTMAHVEPRQFPTKGKPWNSILSQGTSHRVDLILPEACFEVVRQKLGQRASPSYSRVIMSLGQVLDGLFFTEYIKKGSVAMMSEGRTTEDNVFTLRDGLLTMYLDKETYERAGLVGKPYGVKGKRGLRPRWIVSYQLRDPSMLHGKKGFDRLLYACKNALSQPVTWLFCNLSTSEPSPDPLQQHAPVKFTSDPGLIPSLYLQAPSLMIPSEVAASGDRTQLETIATDLYEWISLVRLQSPRIRAGDSVDPYLSRYQIPEDHGSAVDATFGMIRWQGFLTSEWVRQLLVDLLTTLPSQSAFALSATSFAKGTVGDSSEVTFLRPQEAPNHYMLWEVRGEEQ